IKISLPPFPLGAFVDKTTNGVHQSHSFSGSQQNDEQCNDRTEESNHRADVGAVSFQNNPV
ncbi:MAG: hypothetical protein ACPG85_04260, partial [Flavobacteriales bacterium]